jgi:prolyl oligopeptidase PreP (S9A serine peptidase family)
VYTVAPRTNVIDTIHGVAVKDPFRPLENPDDPATIAWVAAENALTRRVLDGPQRDALVERLRRLHRYPRASVAAVRGPLVFFLENDGTRNQPVLQVVRLPDAAGMPDVAHGFSPAARRTLVDPNLLDADGTTAITAFEPDDTGARVVYALSRGGSDEQELAIRDVASNTDLPDRIRWVKFASLAWAGDGFFYTRFPQPGAVYDEQAQYFCQVRYHRIGDHQTADRLVYDRPDAPEVVFDVDVTGDGRHLVITSRRGSSDNAEIHVVRLKPDTTDIPLVRLKPDTTDTRVVQLMPDTTDIPVVRLKPDTTDTRVVQLKADTTDTPVVQLKADTTDTRLVQVVPDTTDIPLIPLKPDTTDNGMPDPNTPVASGFSRTNGSRTSGSRYDVRPLVTGFSAGWHFIDGDDDRIYFLTDADAPLGRIVRFDLAESAPAIHVVVAESADKIDAASIVAGQLLLSMLHNASSRLCCVDLDGRGAREIALPGISTVVGIGGRWREPLCLVTLTSFTTPPHILACDLRAGRVADGDRSALPIDPSAYLTEQVWYPSKDGTPISMFLVSRRGGNGEASGSVLLTGYGGFNIGLTPAFDASDFLWLDAGGVIAVAHLRGGGEYGEAWHRAGMLEKKQTVFDDFIAAAEWLRSSRRAARVAIEGGSNGGLLVGAVMVQRPGLFDAVVCRVPVADMLRYHRFTVGRFWIPEYGSADDPAQFPFLLRYSPYHNVVDGVAYPPTLIMTADTDDRVAPGMAKKFAARLQEAVTADGGPILLRVDTRAGHGAGKPVAKQIQEQADLYAFLFAFLIHQTTRTTGSEH